MLKLRVITAAVLLAVFIAALAAPTSAIFLILILALIVAAGWEWARLIGWPGVPAVATGVLCGAIGLSAWLINSETSGVSLLFDKSLRTFWSIVALLWIIGGAWLLHRGVAHWSDIPKWLSWSVGVLVLCTAQFALMLMYKLGVNFLLSVLALVWVADIAAYFCGRAFGGKFTKGRKLAPTISPGKSWEGAVGGFFGVLILSACWIAVDRRTGGDSLYTILWQYGGLWLLPALLILTAMSIVGDLSESLVKRAAGVKDSSALLPGHGGVLDRIDALLPTLSLTVAIISWIAHK
jgi:phosphatidate cytidylyltransferase